MSLTPDGIVAAIEAVFPCPAAEADAYAAAYWHQEMMYLLSAAGEQLGMRHQEILDIIEAEHLTSDEFTVLTPAIPVRCVNAAALRTALPTVYDSIVRIRATDAERLIGRRKLYELSCDMAGADRVRRVELVNVGDLERALPSAEAACYLTVTFKPGKTVVVRIPREDA